MGGAQVAQFFDGIEVRGNIAEQHRNFYINLAVMGRVLAQVPKHEVDLRTQLAARILNYGYKFATRDPGTVHLYGGNPIQSDDWKNDAYYNRSDKTRLKLEFSKALASALNMPKHQITAVTSTGIHELVKRYHVAHGQTNVCAWQDGSAAQDASFAAEFPNIAQAILQVMSPDERCLYLDISDNLAQLAGNFQSPRDTGVCIQTFKKYVRDVIEYGVVEHVKADETLEPRAVQAQVEKIMARVDDKVMLGGMLKIGNQHVLYQGKMGDPVPSKQAVALQNGGLLMSLDRLKKIKAQPDGPDVTEPPEVPSPALTPEASIEHVGIMGGFVPPPILLMENWFQMVGDTEPILRALSIETRAVFDPDQKNQDLALTFFDSFESFLGHESFQSFKALPASSDEDYLKILPKITSKLIASFQGQGVHEAFEAANLQPLLQFCYQRMVCGMHHAVNDSADFLKCLEHINLIHEEIATLLAVCQPYKAADFDPVMRQVSQVKYPIHDIEPQFYFKNSGMSCLRGALDAMEVCKASADPAGSARLQINFSKNNYFENKFFPSLAQFHEVGNMPTSAKPLDVYLGCFHPSCNTSATRYVEENTVRMVDWFFSKNLVAPHFLVVIDNTISLMGDNPMSEFLAYHQHRIADQSLSVVEIRSLQKTAQAGFDMYAGGAVAVYSHCAPLLEAFAAQDAQTVHAVGNLQGIMHFEKTLGAELDERRMAIVDTARRLNTPEDTLGFPRSMRAGEGCDEVIQVVANDDPESPFVHLSLNNRFVETTGDLLASHLARKAAKEPEKFPLTHRDSFGFNQTNVSDIGTHMRLSPGLESKACIANYRDHIVLLNDVLREGVRRFAQQKEAVIANVLEHGDELIELMGKCQRDPMFEAQPQTKKAIEHAWDRVVFGNM